MFEGISAATGLKEYLQPLLASGATVVIFGAVSGFYSSLQQ